jgi:hypothetical protein
MNNRVAVATLAIIVLVTIIFAVLLLSLDGDSDEDGKVEGAVSTERQESEENKPEDVAAATANALATRQSGPSDTLSPDEAQNATNAMAATHAQATVRAFENENSGDNGTPSIALTRQVTLTIDELRAVEVQEDRMLSVDGLGDEVYMIYVLTERDSAGAIRQAVVESWGVTRMDSGDIINGGEFTPITMTVGVENSVEVAVTVMESEDIARADRFINTLKDDIDTIGSDILDTFVPGESFHVSDLLVVLDLGVEVLEYFGEDDTLGEFSRTYTPENLANADSVISGQETFARDRFLEKFDYRLDYRLRVD